MIRVYHSKGRGSNYDMGVPSSDGDAGGNDTKRPHDVEQPSGANDAKR